MQWRTSGTVINPCQPILFDAYFARLKSATEARIRFYVESYIYFETQIPFVNHVFESIFLEYCEHFDYYTGFHLFPDAARMSEHYICYEVSLPYCPVEYSIYGYAPSLSANAFFTAWFAVLFIPNIVLGVYFKAWTYMVALGLGCAIEALGYGGRIMLHQNAFSTPGFQMQICW